MLQGAAAAAAHSSMPHWLMIQHDSSCSIAAPLLHSHTASLVPASWPDRLDSRTPGCADAGRADQGHLSEVAGAAAILMPLVSDTWLPICICPVKRSC